MRGRFVWGLLGLSLLAVGLTHWTIAAPTIVSAFVILTVYQCLPVLVRCRVCGLRTFTSGDALRLNPGERVVWIWSLDVCPSCGDDGTATSESRARRVASGETAERPYWSRARILIAVLLALAFMAGGVLVAQCRIRSMRQQWLRDGASRVIEGAVDYPRKANATD